MDGLGRFRSHRLRKGRHSEPGRAYLVTTNTRDRRPLFRNTRLAMTVARSIRHMECFGIQTLCYVVMPDHLHWLTRLGDKHDLPDSVGMMKNLVSRRIGMPVWQQGFHDRAVRDEENIRDMARYIVANPIRAGLVDRIGDYPFWDAIWLDEKNNEVW